MASFAGNLAGTLNSFEEGVRAVRTDVNDHIRQRLTFLSEREKYKENYYYTHGPETVMKISEICFIVSGKKEGRNTKKGS